MELKPYQERANFVRNNNKQNRDANGERGEERCAKDSVLRYCYKNFNMEFDVQIAPSILCGLLTLKPDYILLFKDISQQNDQKILLEIRQSGTGFFLNEEGEIKERCEFEGKIPLRLIELQEKMEAWIAPGQTIIIEICSLETSINRKLIDELNKVLKKLFFNNIETINMQQFFIGNEKFYAKSTQYYMGIPEYSPQKTIYGFSFSSCDNLVIENDLSLQARYIIDLCISEKEKRYGKVRNYKKWLVIFNRHFLLMENDYRRVFFDMDKQGFNDTHTFDKIFIVCDTQAYLLYERTND